MRREHLRFKNSKGLKISAWFVLFVLFCAIAYGQDSLKPQEPPQTTPKPEVAPPTATTTSTTPQSTASPIPSNAIYVGSADNYNNNYRRYTAPTDTIVKYIANAQPLKVVRWDAPAIGEVARDNVDTMLRVVKPVIDAAKKWDVVASFDAWREESRSFSVPFQIDNISQLQLSRYFDLPKVSQSDEKLYLYFEGIAWRAELKLNGKFLGINETPFKPWVIPLNINWLRVRDNLLEISLSGGKQFSLYPKSFLGIFRPVYIVNERQLARLMQKDLPQVVTTYQKVAIFAPYYPDRGFVFDKFDALRALLPAWKAGVKYVYFIFPPDKELTQLCKELGFTQVQKLQQGQSVCWLNSYPYETTQFPYTELFWLDNKMYRTQHYGMFYPFGKVTTPPHQHAPSFVFTLLILFPALGLFLVKLFNQRFFYNLGDVLMRPRLQIDRFIEATAGNQGLMFVLQGIRVIILSLTVSLLVKYVHDHNQWQLLTILNTGGILKSIFGVKGAFASYFLKSVAMVSIWAFTRSLLIRFLGRLFRIYNMFEGLTNLELIGAYPVLFVLPMALIFATFASEKWQTLLLTLQYIVWAFYIGRQIYISYIGMERLFKFSSVVKWLYIIVGILLPYVVCL